MNRRLSIGVVGCGTAGAASAIFLARAGHAVTVFERVAAPSAVGAGIVMQPTGQAVLGALGLRDAVVARGARIDRLRCETKSGRRVVDLAYGSYDASYFGVGLHRGVLFDALLRAMKKEPVDLHLGVEIVAVAGARADRASLVASTGERFGPFDLVLVCDGARSRLRDAAPIGKCVSRYEWGALWFVAEDPNALFKGELYQVVDGTQKMLGLLPTGLGPEPGHTTPLVSVYWSLRGDRVEAVRAAGVDAWKKEVLAYAPHAEPLVAPIRHVDELLYAVYHDVAMSRWHTHNVAYLGDAAHAMSPQLGQGCNLALVDAWTLAQALADEETVARALAAYSAAREDHLAFYTFATRWLTPFFQSDAGALAWLRDYGMGTASGIGPFRDLMTASMCGIMTGVVGRMKLPE